MSDETEDQLIANGAWVEFETSYEAMVLRKSQHFVTDEVMWECFGIDTTSPRHAVQMLAEAREAHPELGPECFRVDEYTTIRRAMLMGEILARAEAEGDR